MVKVDLANISVKDNNRWPALHWLRDKYGPAGEKWKLNGVNYVEFENEKEALMFILRWS